MWQILIGPIAELVNTVLRRVLPPEKMGESERAQLEHEITKELISRDWGAVEHQLEINLQEAKHESLFIAGWRPGVGWVCASAFAYHYVVQPVLVFIIAATGTTLPPLPVFDMNSLMTVLLGMLGLGGLRTWEKQKGVNKDR